MSKFAGLAIEVEKSARMTIVNPFTRQPLRDEGGEAFILLHSRDSETARKHQREISRRRLAMATGGRVKVTPEEIEAEATEFLVALTAGWRLLDLDGKPIEVEFSAANARDLYAVPGMAWLVEQIDTFLGDRANFAQASSTG